jgi:hypothetical protein
MPALPALPKAVDRLFESGQGALLLYETSEVSSARVSVSAREEARRG